MKRDVSHIYDMSIAHVLGKTRERRKLVTVVGAAVLGPILVLGFLILMAYSMDSSEEGDV
jgi:hypothetical protein